MNLLQKEKEQRFWNGTFDMCTPRLRCIPEHCMHINIPRFTLAHLGALNKKYIADTSYYTKVKNDVE